MNFRNFIATECHKGATAKEFKYDVTQAKVDLRETGSIDGDIEQFERIGSDIDVLETEFKNLRSIEVSVTGVDIAGVTVESVLKINRRAMDALSRLQKEGAIDDNGYSFNKVQIANESAFSNNIMYSVQIAKEGIMEGFKNVKDKIVKWFKDLWSKTRKWLADNLGLFRTSSEKADKLLKALGEMKSPKVKENIEVSDQYAIVRNCKTPYEQSLLNILNACSDLGNDIIAANKALLPNHNGFQKFQLGKGGDVRTANDQNNPNGAVNGQNPTQGQPQPQGATADSNNQSPNNVNGGSTNSNPNVGSGTGTATVTEEERKAYENGINNNLGVPADPNLSKQTLEKAHEVNNKLKENNYKQVFTPEEKSDAIITKGKTLGIKPEDMTPENILKISSSLMDSEDPKERAIGADVLLEGERKLAEIKEQHAGNNGQVQYQQPNLNKQKINNYKTQFNSRNANTQNAAVTNLANEYGIQLNTVDDYNNLANALAQNPDPNIQELGKKVAQIAKSKNASRPTGESFYNYNKLAMEQFEKETMEEINREIAHEAYKVFRELEFRESLKEGRDDFQTLSAIEERGTVTTESFLQFFDIAHEDNAQPTGDGQNPQPNPQPQPAQPQGNTGATAQPANAQPQQQAAPATNGQAQPQQANGPQPHEELEDEDNGVYEYFHNNQNKLNTQYNIEVLYTSGKDGNLSFEPNEVVAFVPDHNLKCKGVILTNQDNGKKATVETLTISLKDHTIKSDLNKPSVSDLTNFIKASCNAAKKMGNHEAKVKKLMGDIDKMADDLDKALSQQQQAQQPNTTATNAPANNNNQQANTGGSKIGVSAYRKLSELVKMAATTTSLSKMLVLVAAEAFSFLEDEGSNSNND